MITCDEIIDTVETKTVATNFNEIKCILQNKILLQFSCLLVNCHCIIVIAVWIYCYLIKHKSKQKNLLPYHVTNNELINDKLINVL